MADFLVAYDIKRDGKKEFRPKFDEYMETLRQQTSSRKPLETTCIIEFQDTAKALCDKIEAKADSILTALRKEGKCKDTVLKLCVLHINTQDDFAFSRSLVKYDYWLQNYFSTK